MGHAITNYPNRSSVTHACRKLTVIPLEVQDAASIRCIYAYLQQGTTDGQSAFLVKISRDDGATWEPLEYMGIAQALPDAYKNTYDFLGNNEGYGLPASRRLPYADYGLAPLPKLSRQTRHPSRFRLLPTGPTASGWRRGSSFLDPGGSNEEYVCVFRPCRSLFRADADHIGAKRRWLVS